MEQIQEPAGTDDAPAPQTAQRAVKPAIGLIAPPPAGLKAQQLFQEAKKASLEHICALQVAIGVVRELLDDVVEGGEVYVPGLSAFAGRLAEDLLWKSKNLEMLAQRQRLQVEGRAKEA
jgi:hypothetical protein